jgi:vacuolar-type H+-ATPase subunit H
MQPQLRAILEAEAEAQRTLDAAREEAAATTRDAQEDARRRVCAATEARETLARSIEEELVARARESADRFADETRARIATMRARAALNTAGAVEVALGVLVPRHRDD